MGKPRSSLDRGYQRHSVSNRSSVNQPGATGKRGSGTFHADRRQPTIPADPGESVSEVVFSSGGQFLASADNDGNVRLSLFIDPYAALCADDVGPPTDGGWALYAWVSLS